MNSKCLSDYEMISYVGCTIYIYIYVLTQTHFLAMQSGKQHAGLYLSCQNNSLRNKALGNFPFKTPPYFHRGQL